jgi:hypothetical protein
MSTSKGDILINNVNIFPYDLDRLDSMKILQEATYERKKVIRYTII